MFSRCEKLRSSFISHKKTIKHKEMLDLPNEDPAVFSYFLHYLYTEAVEVPMNGRLHQYETLAALYALGERMEQPALQNKVATMIVGLYRRFNGTGPEFPSATAMNQIFNATRWGSPGRRLMMDFSYAHNHTEWPANRGNRLNGDYEAEVQAILRENDPDERDYRIEQLRNGSTSRYHHT